MDDAHFVIARVARSDMGDFGQRVAHAGVCGPALRRTGRSYGEFVWCDRCPYIRWRAKEEA